MKKQHANYEVQVVEESCLIPVVASGGHILYWEMTTETAERIQTKHFETYIEGYYQLQEWREKRVAQLKKEAK